jgi:hypothetical protein
MVVTAAINVSAQSSQTIQAEVPFAFTANGKTLPAGTYRVGSVTDNRTVWRVQGAGSDTDQFLLALNLSGSSKGDLKLIFHRYGDRNFLAGFNTGSYQVELPASKAEKELKSASRPMARIEVDGVVNTAGGSR